MALTHSLVLLSMAIGFEPLFSQTKFNVSTLKSRDSSIAETSRDIGSREFDYPMRYSILRAVAVLGILCAVVKKMVAWSANCPLPRVSIPVSVKCGPV